MPLEANLKDRLGLGTRHWHCDRVRGMALFQSRNKPSEAAEARVSEGPRFNLGLTRTA